MPKAKAVTKPDLTVLDTHAPSLSSRLDKLTTSAKKLTGRWNLGQGVSNPGNDPDSYQQRVYSTGMLSLDKLLKTGGIPRGHITELFGPPSAGKSLLLYNIIREIQHTCHSCWGTLVYADAVDRKGNPAFEEKTFLVKGEEETLKIPQRVSTCQNCGKEDTGGLFALFDQENSFDPVWAKSQGIELTKFLVFKMPSGEYALDLLRHVMNQHSIDGIGIDSIAQLQPKAEQERSSVDDPNLPGLHAKIMSQLCRHVASSFLEDPVNAPAFIWVNQVRADISGNGAINVTGGYAPSHYSSIRLYLLRRGQVNSQHPEMGTEGRITAKKCKAAAGVVNRTLDYRLLDSGFDLSLDIYLTAVDSGVFLANALTSGGHYWAEDIDRTNKLASKRDEAIERVKTDPEFAAEIRKRVLSNSSVQKPSTLIFTGNQVEGSSVSIDSQ